MPLDLPVTSGDHPPAFTRADECSAWLDAQPGDQPVQLQAVLLRQLNQLNRFRLAGTERLAIMELLRGPVHATQEDNVRRFAGKPLPLAPPEQAAFDACIAIWNGLATGYLHCVEACVSHEPGMQMSQALAAQRALAALVSLHYDACRGGSLPPAGHWRRLHQAYAAAEAADLVQREVSDTLRMGRNPATPLATWVEALLLQASGLHELPPRQMVWTARWARRWAGKVTAHKSLPATSTRIIPLCVDVDTDRPAGYRPAVTPGARFLDTSALRSSLKKRVAALEQGELPKNLQLGDDCVQPACQQLLIEMYYRWCKGGARRRNERREAGGGCAVIGGMEAIHYYLSGRKPFAQPGGNLSDTDIRRQRDEIATFGRIMAPQPQMDNYSEQHGYQVEQWEVMEEWHMLDQSAAGARLTRPAGKSGGRFASGQLVAVKPADAKSLLLGTLRWVVIDDAKALHAGVAIIAGKPQAVAVRGTGMDAVGNKYAPAFLLPAMAALGEPPSLVTPPGFFKRERAVELLAERASQIRLTGIIERGSDFERSTYE